MTIDKSWNCITELDVVKKQKPSMFLIGIMGFILFFASLLYIESHKGHMSWQGMNRQDTAVKHELITTYMDVEFWSTGDYVYWKPIPEIDEGWWL